MAIRETELEMVHRHIDEGTHSLARQQRVIGRLRACGHPTDLAERLLLTFKCIQDLHEAHLDRVLKQKRL
jgi:hypothetical protein